MSNPWFRVYAEFSHDPKVQMMTEAMQRRYIMVMCLRCSNALVTLHETEIAFHLRISNEELSETKALFVEKGFIDFEWNLLNWDKRQFVSDRSAPRVAKHRALQKAKQHDACNDDVTLLKRKANALDTDTDTDTDTDKKKKTIHPPSGVSEKVWTDFVQHRKDKRSRITETAIDGIRREADKAGWSLEDALSECCSRGWTGFKADWVSSSVQKKPTNEPEWRSEQRERTARAVPSIAEKKRSEVIEMEAANVVAIALGR